MWLSGVDVALQTDSHQSDSWSGPQPGLRARSQAGHVQEATDRCSSPTWVSLLLSPSSPLSLKINTYFFLKNALNVSSNGFVAIIL